MLRLMNWRHKSKMSSFPFNLVVFDLQRIPPASFVNSVGILGRMNAIKLNETVYLVAGDFITLGVRLLALPGCRDGAIKLYSLSAFDGELDGVGGIHTTIRKQARSHLRHELDKLKLDLPAALQAEAE
jgi:hypothetical protein